MLTLNVCFAVVGRLVDGQYAMPAVPSTLGGRHHWRTSCVSLHSASPVLCSIPWLPTQTDRHAPHLVQVHRHHQRRPLLLWLLSPVAAVRHGGRWSLVYVSCVGSLRSRLGERGVLVAERAQTRLSPVRPCQCVSSFQGCDEPSIRHSDRAESITQHPHANPINQSNNDHTHYFGSQHHTSTRADSAS